LLENDNIVEFNTKNDEQNIDNIIKVVSFKKSENIISGKLINIKIMLRCLLDSLSNRVIIVNRNKHQKNINSFSGLTI
jgi:hypothetical protein